MHEFGAEPVLSVDATIELFNTPWLAGGGGLVLEDDAGMAGYGWARNSVWNCRNYIHVGLFLRRRCRTPASFRVLTEPLLALAAGLGARCRTPEALAYYVSVDTGHPPIVRALGFREMPVSMLGFRHDLGTIPESRPPAGVSIRPARLPEEKKLLLVLAEMSFDDRASQGEPVHEQYLDFLVGRPAFLPEQMVVAEHRGVPVGHAILHVHAEEPQPTAEIFEVGVIPAYRRQGIGRALICRLLSWCRDRGIGTVFTGSFSTNPASTAYWRLGFRPDPLRTYYFFTRRLGSA